MKAAWYMTVLVILLSTLVFAGCKRGLEPGAPLPEEIEEAGEEPWVPPEGEPAPGEVALPEALAEAGLSDAKLLLLDASARDIDS
jgi:hypothetical protein